MNNEDVILEDIAVLESKLKVVRKKGRLDVEARICNVLGKKYEAIGNWKEALRFHYFDWEIAQTIEDWEGIMLALLNMGKVFEK